MRKNFLTRSNSLQLHKIHNYIVGSEIARGEFSSIHEASLINSLSSFAMKNISKKKLLNIENQEKVLFNNLIIAPLINHPELAHVHQVIESSAQIFHVMDIYSNGNLFDFLKAGNLPEQDLISILNNVLSAVQYLHSRLLAHGNINPENILIKSSNNVVLTDYSNLCFFKEKFPLNNKKSVFFAPEIINSNNYDPLKADIWSIGILTYYLFSGIYPETFNDINLELVPDEIGLFIELCTQINPNNRTSIINLRNFSFFKHLNQNNNIFEEINFDRPIIRHYQSLITRLSDFFKITPKEIKDLLLSLESNIVKVLCILLEDSLRTERILKSNLKIKKYPKIRSFSDQDNLLDDNNNIRINYDISLRKFIQENSFKVFLELQSHVLSKNYCISSTLNGLKTLILNKENQDIKIFVEVEDLPDEKSCVISFNSNIESDFALKELFSFINNQFLLI